MLSTEDQKVLGMLPSRRTARRTTAVSQVLRAINVEELKGLILAMPDHGAFWSEAPPSEPMVETSDA